MLIVFMRLENSHLWKVMEFPWLMIYAFLETFVQNLTLIHAQLALLDLPFTPQQKSFKYAQFIYICGFGLDNLLDFPYSLFFFLFTPYV